MKAILAILAVLIGTMIVIPAYATIVEFKTDKTSYIKGDKIQFTGKTDAAHANKMVSIKIYGPQGEFVSLTGGRSDFDSIIVVNPLDTTKGKFAEKSAQQGKGIYNATIIYDDEPNYKGKWTIFDYSLDGSPVSPSAAQIMAQQSQPKPSTPTPSTPPASTPTQPTTPAQPTQPAQPTTPPTTQPVIPKCGTGTVYDQASGTCIVAPAAEPEPELEPEVEPAPQEETSGPKKTHIPGFPDPTKDPQYYIDRYNNEPTYKEWFDRNFPDDSIYEILGVKGPKKTHIPGFPDPTKDPQSYIDRYNNEPTYKEWFDKNFPDDTIYEIVGVDEPAPPGVCGPGTHDENGVCVLDKKQGLGQCAIATAAFGTELAHQVQMLREIRDSSLLGTNSGTIFMAGFNDFYYTFSPTIADWERQSPAFRELVKITITPMLSTLSILQFADIDSEQEMLGYGIGLILLNAGIYFVAPAIILVKTRKYLKF
ncbi:CFI-box-CTERM domain-containing protein [Candidatus Nitrosotenuis aquarius]|uniref:CFI-box-CTERM domain-containing protein n=1 Tax=Candidatus Nitrosotenuis aquarius TaxID=1846278 RepID=UPI0015B0A46D|nr:CFI-box-CTERM domain-containing protein [Candidatus Nitrosotenuis aquarius]